MFALLSPFSKILEKIISDQLNSFIEKHNILFPYQFGFRKGYSIELAILEMSDNLRTSIDNKLITCGLFLDFSKAFDTVNHTILLHKLYKYGIRGLAFNWFKSYLQNRSQYVKIGNVESDQLNVVCGIPQGSTLGPLLFLLYINDLPNSSTKLSFRLFADDANIFYASKDLNEIEVVMNEEFQNILKFCNANKLSINMKKTNFMLISSPNKVLSKNVRLLNIEQKKCIKYLGIYMDEHLTWKDQITHVTSKISKNLGIFYKLRKYLNVHMLRQLYYTLIYPYLNYGCMSWGSTYPSNLKKTAVKQNNCVRSILFANNKQSATPCYQLLEILKFEDIVKLKIAMLTHKLFVNPFSVPSLFHDFLMPVVKVHSYNTRHAARHNFYRPKIRTNFGKFTFKYYATVLWENISVSLKNLPTSSNFKKQYKLHLLLNQRNVP